MIPETQDTKAIVAHPGIARCVGRRPEMLAAVDLNNKSRLDADKIGDVRADWVLLAKAEV